jgi:hypothetical protein
MWKNVYNLKERLVRYQNCEELQEELQLYLFSFYLSIFKAVCIILFYSLHVCILHIAGIYFGFG